MGFRVINAHTGETLPGLPTPRLIEAGGGEAYFSPTTSPRWEPRGTWYLHVPGRYEDPTGTYTRVRIVHTDDYKVTIAVTVTDGPDVDSYEDWFVVHAADRAEADQLALKAAAADVERRNGPDMLATFRIISTRMESI